MSPSDAPPPSPPPPSSPSPDTNKPRGGRSAAPVAILLIFVGALMLALNLGWLRVDAIVSVLSLWPLALVAVGVDLITRGRYRLPIWIVVVIIAGLAAFGQLGPLGNLFGVTTRTTSVAGQESVIDVPADGARRLELEVDTGVTEFRLDSTTGTGSSLLTGTIRTADNETLEQRVDRTGDTVEVALDVRTTNRFWSFGTMRNDDSRLWELHVARGVPLRLSVDTGVGLTALDLRHLDLEDLRVNAGVGEVRVTLPERGGYEAEIDAGVGEIDVTVPEGAPVRILADTGIGSLNANGFLAVGGGYETAEYADAPRDARAIVSIDGGLGSIILRR